ncbi:MAG: DUF3168 domain-containing protein [Alphaproteobacteria bacterium]|nr:DUF3168 domain-containing protein [Alphaproteobacteria bacterium]
MNGVAIIRAMLVAHAPLVAAVPEDKIMAGIVPQGTPLPALELRQISGVDRHTLKRGASRRVTDRVQVMVMASTYPRQKALIELVRAAIANETPGNVAGVSRVVVHTQAVGPDLDGPAGICMQPQDFRVSYNEA